MREKNLKRQGFRLFRATFFAVPALLVLLVSGCYAVPASLSSLPATRERYQLRVNSDGVKLDVQVNDMPIALSTRGEGFGVSVINNLLTGANNALTVIVRPLHGTAHALVGASMHLDITAYSDAGDEKRKVARPKAACCITMIGK